jgi:hypothetical protein
MKPDGITVIDVMRNLGVEPETHLAWRVGALARSAYKWETGNEPPKYLRCKTSAGGSHCFAVYPESMRSRIEMIIRNQQGQARLQADLFSESEQ